MTNCIDVLNNILHTSSIKNRLHKVEYFPHRIDQPLI